MDAGLLPAFMKELNFVRRSFRDMPIRLGNWVLILFIMGGLIMSS